MDIEQRLKRIEEKLGIVDEPAKEPGQVAFEKFCQGEWHCQSKTEQHMWVRIEEAGFKEREERRNAIGWLRSMVNAHVPSPGSTLDAVRDKAKKFLETIE